MKLVPFAVVLVLLLALAPPAQAAAGPNAFEQIFAVDTGKAKLVLASSPSGMVILNDKLEVYRIYRYQPLSKKDAPRVLVADLYGEGHPEIIGIGKPTFGLDATGNPLWDFPEGCSELATGDLLATPEKEVACIHGKALTVLACDGSLDWEVKLSSTGMAGLAAGMLGTTDGKEGLEFTVGKEILRFKGDGTALGAEFTERATTPPETAREQKEAAAALLSGKTEVDLDGDGAAGDTLQVDGAKLLLKVKDKEPVTYVFPGGVILAAAVAEGFGEKPLVVVGGERTVAFVGADGKAVKELTLDFKRVAREPKVDIVGVNAVGFEQRTSVEKVFAANQSQINACYERRHRAYDLTRQGKTMFKFDVSEGGKVSHDEVPYTTLNDPEVNGCISKAVKGWSFPKPTEANAYFTADLLFTWTDSFK